MFIQKKSKKKKKMGDFLSTPNKEKESSDDENSYIRYGASAMQGWRYRMEDAHITSLNNNNKFDIFGVFDGHGGKEVSQFAKNHFVKEFLKNKNTNQDNIKKSLEETFLKIDELLMTENGKKELKEYSKKSKKEDEEQDKKNKISNEENEYKKFFDPKSSENCDIAQMTGCTSCICIIDEINKKIYFANSGDSRVVLCKKGKAYQMSLDHKPDLSIEKNRIYKANGWVSEGRIKGNLNLSRSLGDLEYKQNKNLSPQEQMITAFPDVNIEKIDDNCDFIIIGCDGIWDCLSNQQACDYVKNGFEKKKYKNISSIIEDMMDSILAKDKMNEMGIGCDNMSCIVIKFKH